MYTQIPGGAFNWTSIRGHAFSCCERRFLWRWVRSPLEHLINSWCMLWNECVSKWVVGKADLNCGGSGLRIDPVSSRLCRISRLRDYTRVYAPTITNPPAKCGDYGKPFCGGSIDQPKADRPISFCTLLLVSLWWYRVLKMQEINLWYCVKSD